MARFPGLPKTKAQIKREAEYHQSLGQFVTEFSNVEALLHGLVSLFAGVKQPTANAVFSGVRIEAAMSYINRIADAQKWRKEKKARLQIIFTQLGQINKLRNEILHYGSTVQTSGTVLITNKSIVHLKSRIQERRISAAVLNDATNDLMKIFWLLVAFAWRPKVPMWQKIYRSILGVSWFYKPQQPRPPARRSRRNRLKPQPPPTSSRA